MIEFQKLTFQNFFSYRDKQEIPLQNQGLVQLKGINLDEGDSNRTGKSAAIPEALVWTLFGKTIRGLKHDKVVHRFVGKDCFAKTSFFTAHDTHYQVARYRKHTKYKNNVRLWVGSKELSFRHQEDTQQRIEEIIGCDYNSFVNSVVFGGTKPFPSLSDAEQKRVLESFLHFEKLDDALQFTKGRLKQSKEKLQNLEVKRAELQAKVHLTRGTLKSLLNNERLWKQERQGDREKLERQVKELNAELPQKDYTKKVIKLENRLAHRQKKLNQTDSYKHIVEDRLNSVVARILERKNLRGRPCPTCGQEVSGKSAEKAHKALRHERNCLLPEHEKLATKSRRQRIEVERTRERLNRVQDKQNRVTKKLIIRRELRRGLLNQLKQAQGEARETPFATNISTTEVSYSWYLAKRLLVEWRIQSLRQEIEDLEFWVMGFGNQGVKALIVRKALPAMNAKLKEFSEEIFGSSAKLQFNPTKTTKKGVENELFNLQYEAKYGDDSYVGESAGGKKRIDICVLLVFAWIAKTCNLLVVDELLDGLDTAGQESVLRILSRLRGTVICISHNNQLKAKFPAVWTVTKYHGRSKLEVA